jgi:hypothetical protein
MNKQELPDCGDVEGVIVDYLDTLAPELHTWGDREKVIANCVVPFSLLIWACEIAGGQGESEAAIWSAFMRDLALARRASIH